MHYFKWIGNPECKELWENKEALEKYLARLKELMEEDEEKIRKANLQEQTLPAKELDV